MYNIFNWLLCVYFVALSPVFLINRNRAGFYWYYNYKKHTEKMILAKCIGIDLKLEYKTRYGIFTGSSSALYNLFWCVRIFKYPTLHRYSFFSTFNEDYKDFCRIWQRWRYLVLRTRDFSSLSLRQLKWSRDWLYS